MAVPKPLMPLVAMALFLAGGVLLLSSQYLGVPPHKAATLTVAVVPPPEPEIETTGALPATAPALQTTQPAPAQQPTEPDRILVSKKPIAVLAGPSPDAAPMYGFPSGRPFRVISREAGYAQIRDLKSGASGWIEEAALVPAPRAPIVSRAPSAGPAKAAPQAKTKSVPPKTKASPQTKPAAVATETAAAAEPEIVQKRRRGIFGLRRNSDERPAFGFGFGGR